jgi:hypothetical protein
MNNLCSQCLYVNYLEAIYRRRLETKDHKYICLKQDILCTQMSEATSLSKGVPGEMVFYYRGTN